VLLVRQAALSVWTLWIALTTIYRLLLGILRCSIDLLRLVLSRSLACGLVTDRWELRTTSHVLRHHAGLTILAWSTLRWAGLAVPSSFLACALLFLLTRILLFLLLRLPLFANLFEFFWSAFLSVRLHGDVSVQMIQRSVRLFAAVPSALVHSLDLFVSPSRSFMLLRTRNRDE